MISLRTLVLASALGLLAVGPASASNAWPLIPSSGFYVDPADAGDPLAGWTADAAGLQTGRSVHEAAEHPMRHYKRLHHGMRHDRVHANGLCNGRSHGTGDHSCGTATGGPVGGNASRN